MGAPGRASKEWLERSDRMRERLEGRTTPMTKGPTGVTDACMCGGTIRVDGDPTDQMAIRDAVQAHNATERHRAYVSGAKYLP